MHKSKIGLLIIISLIAVILVVSGVLLYFLRSDLSSPELILNQGSNHHSRMEDTKVGSHKTFESLVEVKKISTKEKASESFVKIDTSVGGDSVKAPEDKQSLKGEKANLIQAETTQKVKQSESKLASRPKKEESKVLSSNVYTKYSNHSPYGLATSSTKAKQISEEFRKDMLETFEFEDLNKSNKDDSEDRMVIFSAVVKNMSGAPIVGGFLSLETPVKLNESGVGEFEVLGSNFSILAVTDKSGRCVFKLGESSQITPIYFLYNKKVFRVFNQKILDDFAWVDHILSLEIDLMFQSLVFGRVTNIKGQGVDGAIISNRRIDSLVEHQSFLEDKNYRFSISNAKGGFIIGGLEIGQSILLHCFLSGYPANSSKEFTLTAEKPTKKIDFRIVQEAQLPGKWSGVFVDKSGEPVEGVKLSTELFSSYAQAINSQKIVETSATGNFSVLVNQFDEVVSLYSYDELNGMKKVDSYLFKPEEEIFKNYIVEPKGQYKGALTFRIQDKNGKDVKSGWVCTGKLNQKEEFEALISQGGFGGPLLSDGKVKISNLFSDIEFDFYYCNEIGTPIFLGSFMVGRDEKVEKLIRLDESALISCSLSGRLMDEMGSPISNKSVLLSSAVLEKEVIANLDENGNFLFLGLPKYIRARLSVDDRQYSNVDNTFLLDKDDNNLGEIIVKQIRTQINLRVLSGNQPIEGVSVNLIIDGLTVSKETSNELGQVSFSIVNSGECYAIFQSTYYEEKKVLLFNGEYVANQVIDTQVNIEPKKMVIVHLTDYSWDKPMFIKSYIVKSNEKALIADNTAGNSYAEVVKNGEIYFLSPPEEEFFIYVGGMDDPYASGLFGPFKADPNKKQFEVDLPVKEVKPIRVRLTNKNKPRGWNLNIHAVRNFSSAEKNEWLQSLSTQSNGDDDDSEVFKEIGFYSHPVKSIQLGGEYTPYYYLMPGYYVLEIMDNQGEFKDLKKLIYLEEGKTFEVELMPKDVNLPKGGYVKSYIVSDRFDLGISSGNTHHQELCPGFEKDHIGGEGSFQAEHLGVYDSPDKKSKISWTKESFQSGILDFTKKFPHPKSDYAVAYAQYTIICDEPRTVWLGVSADDGLKVWHNGTLILYRHRATPLGNLDHKLVGREADGDKELVLKKGENLFVFKVDNSWGHWALRSRFIDPNSLQALTDLKFKDGDGFTAHPE